MNVKVSKLTLANANENPSSGRGAVEAIDPSEACCAITADLAQREGYRLSIEELSRHFEAIVDQIRIDFEAELVAMRRSISNEWQVSLSTGLDQLANEYAECISRVVGELTGRVGLECSIEAARIAIEHCLLDRAVAKIVVSGPLYLREMVEKSFGRKLEWRELDRVELLFEVDQLAIHSGVTSVWNENAVA